jgi:hypothetical protein
MATNCAWTLGGMIGARRLFADSERNAKPARHRFAFARDAARRGGDHNPGPVANA